MNKIGGSAFFVDISGLSADDVLLMKFFGEKVMVVRDNFCIAGDLDAALLCLKNAGFNSIITTGSVEAYRNKAVDYGIETISVDGKSLEDMFHTFKDKDTEISFSYTEENYLKIKLISGSLSKSYQLKNY